MKITVTFERVREGGDVYDAELSIDGGIPMMFTTTRPGVYVMLKRVSETFARSAVEAMEALAEKATR